LNDASFNCRHLAGQGATEYLVLLAVVLIVALISVALLGFFPGMASDAQRTQVEAYWKSASPIAIMEWAAKYYDANSSHGYLRVRNSGAYPIRITKLLANGQSISNVWNSTSGFFTISSVYYMAPGEEKAFGNSDYILGIGESREIGLCLPNGTGHYGSVGLAGADSVCSAVSSGTVVMRDFGFEYIEYVEGQQVTKREIGKPLMIKCS